MTVSRYGGRMRPIGVGSENMPSVESPDNATPIPAGHMRGRTDVSCTAYSSTHKARISQTPS